MPWASKISPRLSLASAEKSLGKEPETSFKAYDEALKLVSGSFPKDFAALASDRRGDILLAQGKKNEAKAEYEKAYKGLDERAEYRRLVEVKLNALGVDPAATSPSSSSPATPAADSEVKK